jgi:citrate lyase subunit beta/citryl-CoA lyase
MRPFRTLMFVPGSDARKIAKVFSLAADAVVLDLEDSVALKEKPAARETVREALGARGASRVYVRVNALSTGLLFDDLAAVIRGRPNGIVLPKADSPADLITAAAILAEAERKEGLDPGSVDLIPIVESAAGIARAEGLASSCERVRRLSFGAMDFTLDIGATWDKEGTALHYARSHLVIASRAAGIEAPIDTVYPDIRDTDGLVADSKLARKLGFQGKIVIHPAQVEPVNQVFSPTPEEVAKARRAPPRSSSMARSSTIPWRSGRRSCSKWRRRWGWREKP